MKKFTGLLSATLAGIAFLMSTSTVTAAGASTWRFGAGYQALYESNIYHSYIDTSETPSMLNVMEMEVSWRLKQSPSIRHRLEGAVGLDLYPNYSNRNKSTFGVLYEPSWRYFKNGRLIAEAEVSRRNKDLIDDAGQVLSRTLQKWELDLSLTNTNRFGPFKTELSVAYGSDNYDERDTLVINVLDTSVVHLKSYDYHAYYGTARVRYYVTPKIEVRATFDTEKRYYDERRTYTVQYGATRGRPFEIREYRENAVELSMACEFYKRNEISADVEFTRRRDNFENFYGYEQRQYRVTLRLEPLKHHHTTVSFRFKNKDYPNYWNRGIGLLNRVSVDYADFQIEHEYELSDLVTLTAYIRNYNKVSNDPLFDYNDITAGTGIEFRM